MVHSWNYLEGWLFLWLQTRKTQVVFQSCPKTSQTCLKGVPYETTDETKGNYREVVSLPVCL